MKKLLFLLFSLFVLFSSPVQAKIVDPSKVYTYEQLLSDVGSIKEAYGDLVQIKTIGQTYFGNNILAIKLGTGKKNILFIGAHHGREWLTSSLLMVMLESYVNSYKNGAMYGPYHSSGLNEISIWFIPMLNPDGVMIQQNSAPEVFLDQVYLMNEGSHNFSRWKANGIGIDLNRQYPAGWRELPKTNSPSYQFYKGKKPLQAREVVAITKFVNEIQPLIAVAYHSSGQEIYWNYHNGENTRRDKRIAVNIAELTGYSLGKPPKRAVGGGFTDWFIASIHRPALTIEICPSVEQGPPPIKTFKDEWHRNQYVGFELIEEAKKLIK